jgi:hypothetical protein
MILEEFFSIGLRVADLLKLFLRISFFVLTQKNPINHIKCSYLKNVTLKFSKMIKNIIGN